MGTEVEDTSHTGPDFSSPAAQAYAKRQNVRMVWRRDETDNFRPLTEVGMLTQRDAAPQPLHAQSPLRKTATTGARVMESPSSRWMHGVVLPGFGDNEAHGKALPCEHAPEDGLMRINVHTVSILLYTFDFSFNLISCTDNYHIV